MGKAAGAARRRPPGARGGPPQMQDDRVMISTGATDLLFPAGLG